MLDYFTQYFTGTVENNEIVHQDTNLTLEQKWKKIDQYWGKYQFNNDYTLSNKEILYVYDAYFYNIFREDIDKNVMFYYGVHFFYSKNYDMMKFYWLQAVENDHYEAIASLGTYYHLETNEHDNIIKYLSRASAIGYIMSTLRLAKYYREIGDHDNSMIYFLLALNDNLKTSRNCRRPIGHINNIILKSFVEEIELFDKYADKILTTMEKLITKNLFDDNVLKIITIIDSKHFIGCSLFLQSYKKLLTEQINLIDLHFNYSPDSKGYQQAKEDFLQNLLI